MINDDLKNIDKYCEIPNEVSKFLKSLDANYQSGHYEINEKTYANIDIYDTEGIINRELFLFAKMAVGHNSVG